MITLKKSTIQEMLNQEWLETNGLGGYASSTLLNCHTRRYHGLLVANLQKPPGKFVLLSKVEDTLLLDNKTYPLSSHQYLDYFYQGGYPQFEGFVQDTHPSFYYKIEDFLLKKEILMLHNQDSVIIKYTLLEEKPSENKVKALEIKAFIAYREFHALLKKSVFSEFKIANLGQGTGIQLVMDPAMPTLFLQTTEKLQITALVEADWYFNFEYQQEKARGFDYLEDLFLPCKLYVEFDHKGEILFSGSTTKLENLNVAWETEIARRKSRATNPEQSSSQYTDLKMALKKASEQFMVSKESNFYSIIAGYHWFLEWGRDAMIALPGLTLYSGLEKICLRVLMYFASQQRLGLIPNFINTAPLQNAYDTVDASLWYCAAVQQYYLKTLDLESIKIHLWPYLKNIIQHYRSGTEYNIKQEGNGLIYAGSPFVKVTWMDVMINQIPITPRNGAAVEVNALWYNAICFINELAKKLDDPLQKEIEPLESQIKRAFQDVFWDEEQGCLRDYVNQHHSDNKIRPNQIFAVSLPYSPLDLEKSLKVVNLVQDHLLTPYGLRTLSPYDKDYKAHYKGGPLERDSAYHNGTVWPWLLCAFGEALIKVRSKKAALAILQPCLESLNQHTMNQAGIGSISEIFDGNAPHHPNGCISQAWSVAEINRLIHILGF